MLVNGQRHSLLISVRLPKPKVATIDMSLDGKPYLTQWQGKPGSCSVPESWSLPHPQRAGIGQRLGLVTFHAVRLRMVSGQASLGDSSQTEISAAQSTSTSGPKWLPLHVESATSAIGATLSKESDNAVFASGKLGEDTYTVTVKTHLRGITAFRLEALADPRLPNSGPGRSANGNFVLTGIGVTAAPALAPASAESIALQNPQADYNQPNYIIASALRGDPNTGWAIDPQFGRDHVAVFECNNDVGFIGGTVLRFTIAQQYRHEETPQQVLGKFRLSATLAKRPVRLGSEGTAPR